MPTVRYRDPSNLQFAAIGTLAAGVALDIRTVILLVRFGSLTPLNLDIYGPLHIAVRIATAVAFLIWVDRVYANAEALTGETEHGRAWATVAFVVPVVNLFRPYQILDETWLRSAGGARDDGPRRSLLLAWWLLFLAAVPVMLFVALHGGWNDASKMSARRAAETVNVLAGMLAIAVVRLITERQVERWQRTRREQAALAVAERRAAMMAASSPEYVPASARRPVESELSPYSAMPAAAAMSAVASMQAPAASRPIAPRPERREVTPLYSPAALHRRSALDAIPDSYWNWTLVGSVGVSALALAAAAAALAFSDDRSRQIAAIVYAVFAVILGAGALLLRRSAGERAGDPAWNRIITIAASAAAAANLIGILEWFT